MQHAAIAAYPLHRQTGLSLVELMISLTIGLVLLLGMITLLVQQNSSRTEMEKSSRQIENGRYAMQLLHDDIQLAGYFGEYSPPINVATAITDPCATTGTLGWNSATPQVPVALHGYAGAATDPTPTACLDNYKANTDVLVIRRTSTVTPIAAGAAVANTTYLQVSNCTGDGIPFVLGTGGFTLHQMNCIAAPPGTLATLQPYIVRIYYLSTCSVCGTDTIPTLKMVEFTDGVRKTVPLVEGIEDMQLDYGVDNLDQDDNSADGIDDEDMNGDGLDDGDGTPDDYLAVLTAANWVNVMAVRVHLLSRNNDPTANYTDAKSYNMGSAGMVTPGGAYKRHVYTQLVRAINPSGRREGT